MIQIWIMFCKSLKSFDGPDLDHGDSSNLRDQSDGSNLSHQKEIPSAEPGSERKGRNVNPINQQRRKALTL
jgi:hypothetical protein